MARSWVLPGSGSPRNHRTAILCAALLTTRTSPCSVQPATSQACSRKSPVHGAATGSPYAHAPFSLHHSSMCEDGLHPAGGIHRAGGSCVPCRIAGHDGSICHALWKEFFWVSLNCFSRQTGLATHLPRRGSPGGWPGSAESGWVRQGRS